MIAHAQRMLLMLCQSTESMILISFFKLWVMWLRPNQWQVVSTSVSSMLDAELASSSSGSIDHLGVVIVSLSIYLMAQVLLINALRLLTLTTDSVHHIWTCAYVRTVSALEWLEMRRLSRGDDRFLWILWADIVVLMSLSAVDPIHCVLLLVAQVDLLRCCVRHLRWHLSRVLGRLRRCLSSVLYNFLTWIIKRYMNSSVSITYETGKILKMDV